MSDAKTPDRPQEHPLCPVCLERGGTNEEDAQPKWLRRKLIDSFPEFANTRRHTVRICEPCNTFFGRNYEDPTAPLLKRLLDGEVETLSREEQQRLGKWFAKTILMLALRLGRHPQWGSQSKEEDAGSKLRYMKERGVPPPGTTVRLGNYDEKLRREEVPPTPDVRPPLVVNVHGVIQPTLYFEVLMGRVEVVLQIEFERPPQEKDWFLRVWPQQPTDATWPPPRTLGQASTARLSVAWQPPQSLFVTVPGQERTLQDIFTRGARPNPRPVRSSPDGR